MNQEWFSAAEMAGLAGVPSTTRGVIKAAAREGWQSRRRQKGKGLEYHLSSLPPVTQAALLKQNATPGLVGGATSGAAGAVPESFTYDAKALWARYERKSTSQKAKAQALLTAISTALALIDNGIPRVKAWETAASTHGTSSVTLHRQYKKVRRYNRADWLAALAPDHVGRIATAECSDDAWEFFKADYLRLEKPSAAACYGRLKRASIEHGWTIPALRTLERRINDIPRTVRVLMRDGEQALMRLYPAQQRTVRDLHALQWINGDGYQHNVFVRWPNGVVERPKTWVWQDIYSRKILAFRTDSTEHTDLIRVSFGDLVEDFGIPEHVTIDNTRAAANKWMTGGVPNRYRFKVKEDDPLGLFPTLGIRVHWTSVHAGRGHGQAKPVERAFGVGGLGEVVDKHPAFAGAYTGNSPMAKPENYGSKAIPIETFLQVLTDEIAAFNAREGRRTEICAGALSFDQAFNASYQHAPIQKATDEQRRLWLMTAEAIRVQHDGTFTLDAGSAVGVGRNRYSAPDLLEYNGHKMAVRFDPEALHESVYVYTLDGRFVCQARCIEATGFGDTEAGRAFARVRKQFIRATKQAAEAETRMSALELAQRLPATEQSDAPESKVVRPLRPAPELGRPAPEAALSEEKRADIEQFRASFEQPARVIEADDPRRRYGRWVRLHNRVESGEQLPEQELRFYVNYQRGDEFQSMKSFFSDFGMAGAEA